MDSFLKRYPVQAKRSSGDCDWIRNRKIRSSIRSSNNTLYKHVIIRTQIDYSRVSYQQSVGCRIRNDRKHIVQEYRCGVGKDSRIDTAGHIDGKICKQTTSGIEHNTNHINRVRVGSVVKDVQRVVKHSCSDAVDSRWGYRGAGIEDDDREQIRWYRYGRRCRQGSSEQDWILNGRQYTRCECTGAGQTKGSIGQNSYGSVDTGRERT